MPLRCAHCGRALPEQSETCPFCEKPLTIDIVQPDRKRKPPGIAELGVKKWVTNIFWFHYRAHVYVTLFIALIAGIVIHSFVTREKTDFTFVIVSEYPLIDDQGVALAAFWETEVPGVSSLAYSVLDLSGLSEVTFSNAQMLFIANMSDEHSLFIVGESALKRFAPEQIAAFSTADELGLTKRDKTQLQLIPLEGIALMEELMLIFEPMYAMVKRPAATGQDRYDLSVACLKALLEI